MKEKIRSLIKSFYNFGFNQIDKPKYRILFSDFSYTIIEPLKSVIDNKCRCYFLPFKKKIDPIRFFDWKKTTYEDFVINSNDIVTNFSILVKYSEDYLIDKKIDFLVVSKLPRNDLLIHSLVAASINLKIKIIYLDHGDTGTENKHHENMWCKIADYYYVNNTEMQKYLIRENNDNYKQDVIIKQWRRPMQNKRRDIDKKLILFAPGFYNGDVLISLYSDAMRFKNNSKILFKLNDVAERYNLRVVWKSVKGSNETYDPIKDIININRLNNIEYVVSNSFNKLLSVANMFITDCVSTTLYDSVNLGVNSLCVHFDKAARIRDGVKKEFGESIYKYSDINSALYRIETFISNVVLYSKDHEISKIKFKKERDLYPWEN